MEEAGGVSAADRLSRHPSVLATARSLEAELRTQAGAKEGGRRAPCLPTALVESLEYVVVSTMFDWFTRVFAWYRLVRVWASLRFNDTLHIAPCEMVFEGGDWTFTLSSSKTTGPDKRVGSLRGTVSRGCYLLCENWLLVGWSLQKERRGGEEGRSYMMPLPSRDLQGFRGGQPATSRCA